MFIDFEGIDGSGKTTLSNLLAARLKRLGYKVAHAREGGELQSPLARRIRDLTRDAKHLEMSPEAEFFLNLARDSQQLAEVIAPALHRGEVCITDRYLYSQLALTGGGRGLPLDVLRPACEVASQGLWPDLIVLVDVEPDLARLRKRLGKVKEGRNSDTDSRKGLAGAGLAVRVRESFRALASQDPGRWLIIENNDQPLWVLEQRIVDAVVARLEGRELSVQRIIPESSGDEAPVTHASVEDRFFEALDPLEAREPALAVWALSGVPGYAAHRRRLSTLERFPGLTARSLAGLFDEASWDLRELLEPLAPQDVAESLGSNASPRAMAARARLYPRAPRPVLSGLKRDDSPAAWALRERGEREGHLRHVLVGLGGLESEAAWAVRERGVQAGLHAEAARSLSGLASPRAEALREALWKHDRLAVLKSTHGLDTPQASGIRQTLMPYALKTVMRSLSGLTSDEAFEMRARGARQTKEAIDSIDGLDDPRAWALREACVGRWPTTVLSSMKGLPLDARAKVLIDRALEVSGGRLPALRNAYGVIAHARERARAEHASPERAPSAELPQAALSADGGPVTL